MQILYNAGQEQFDYAKTATQSANLALLSEIISLMPTLQGNSCLKKTKSKLFFNDGFIEKRI